MKKKNNAKIVFDYPENCEACICSKYSLLDYTETGKKNLYCGALIWDCPPVGRLSNCPIVLTSEEKT